MRDFLNSVLGFLAILAAQTASKVDDKLVDLIKAIVDDEALIRWFIPTYASAPDEGVLSLTAEPPAEVVAAFKARGFEWSAVLELLPVLIQILRAFRPA